MNDGPEGQLDRIKRLERLLLGLLEFDLLQERPVWLANEIATFIRDMKEPT